MKKNYLIIAGIIVFGILFYGLTLRGDVGSPTSSEFKNKLDTPTSAFELSPERGRYVHVVAMAETGRFDITKDWAEVAYPDVGISNDGRYYSFFAPGVAYLALPLYQFGSQYNLGQVAAFSSESIISIVTLIFIYLIAFKVFLLPRWAAFFSVLVYAFASTSWSYAITLYQNAFTTCFIITGYYAVWRYSKNDRRYSFLYAAYAWLAYALAILVDYPNVLLYLPIIVYLAFVTFSLKKVNEGYEVTIRWASVLTAVAFVALTGLHFWHNTHYYGKWDRLAGTLKNYERPIATSTRIGTMPSTHEKVIIGASSSTTLFQGPSKIKTEPEKTAVGFFHEKNIPHGLYILLFSDERGLLIFSPIFALALFGMFQFFRKKSHDQTVYLIPIFLVLINIFLYASWGDPWGGWAYGPRYLIPSLPWLAIFVGVFVSFGRFS